MHLMEFCLGKFGPYQSGRHFTKDIFKSIFLYEKYDILVQRSLKYIQNCPLDDKSELGKVIA